MRSGSTTRSWYKAKLASAPQGQAQRAVRRSVRFPQSDRRSRRTVTLQWKGGSEPWVEITTPHGTVLRPGTMELWELLVMLAGGE